MSNHTAFPKFRKDSGLTLDKVAEIFDVDRTTILRWEKGTTPVPTKRLAEIEGITGIPQEDLRPDIFKAGRKPRAIKTKRAEAAQ